MTKESSHSRAIFFNMYFEVLSEIRFRKHPSQSSLYFNGAEYFYHQSWSSNYLFLRVCGLYVLYDSWVSTDLSVSIKTTTTTVMDFSHATWAPNCWHLVTYCFLTSWCLLGVNDFYSEFSKIEMWRLGWHFDSYFEEYQHWIFSKHNDK